MKYITLVLIYISIAFCATSKAPLSNSLATGIETSDSLKIIKYMNEFNAGNHNIVDFLINLYNKYDIIILGERDHRDTTQYSFIKDIVSDKRFIENVGYIYTEVGCNTATESANDLIKRKFKCERDFRQAAIEHLRKEEWWPLWEKWNRYQLLRDLSSINDSLPNNKKLNLGLTDVNYPWDRVKTPTDYKLFYEYATYNRDYIMSQNFSYMYLHQEPRNGKRKALLITNAPHAINDSIARNEGWFIKQGFGDKVAIILMNWDEWWQKEYTLLDNGRVDAAFHMIGNKPTALNLQNCLIGNIHNLNKTQLKNLADFIIFDTPIDKFVCKCGLKGLISSDFEAEIMRRDKFVGEAVYPDRSRSSLESLYWEYNRERCFNPYSESVLWQFIRFIKK